MFVLADDCKACQQCFPVIFQFCKGLHRFFHCIKSFNQCFCRGFIDNSGSFPFIICRIFTISQHKNKFFFLSRQQSQIYLMCSNGIPSACNRVTAFFLTYSFWKSIPVSCSQKSISVGIIIVHLGIYCKETVMFPSFSVFCLMINRTPLYFHFSDT